MYFFCFIVPKAKTEQKAPKQMLAKDIGVGCLEAERIFLCSILHNAIKCDGRFSFASRGRNEEIYMRVYDTVGLTGVHATAHSFID